MKKMLLVFALMLGLVWAVLPSTAVAAGSKAGDDAHRWRVEDLYASPADWEQDLDRLRRELTAFADCKDKLAKSPERMGACLDQQFAILSRQTRLITYASLVHDQDRRDPKGQKLFQRAEAIGTETKAALSFVRPDILRIPPRKLKSFLKSKRLTGYRQYIDNITRRRAHVLSPIAEETIARAGDLANLPQNVYMTVADVNAEAPVVTLSDGKQVAITRTNYMRTRAAPVREDRAKVFKAFWGTYRDFRETYAGLLSGAVSRDHYYAKVRNYKSDLEAALDEDNIPIAIYTNMIKQVRAGRNLLWRYLGLRRKMLGLEDLRYHDLYTSIVPSRSMEYSWQDTRRVLLSAMAPLGSEYGQVLKQAFDNRWIDVYPAADKRSNGAVYGDLHGAHPYVLLNHNDDYLSLTMAAHEVGNAVHSHLSHQNQKVHNAKRANLVSLVAANVNENLLRLHLYSQATDRQQKLYLLGQYLETWRQVLFRQALFSEFELALHKLAKKGIPLTADRLDQTYLELLRVYYGDAKGVTKIDPLYAVEWAYVTHIYQNFFVYQYPVSFIAGTAIAEKIFSGDTRTRDAYLTMLKSGGAQYPTELFKLAGVDLSRPRPYRESFRALAKALDEVERLVAEEEQSDGQVAQPLRSQVKEEHKWDLGQMYGDVKAWEKDLAQLERDLGKFSRCKGKLGSSPARLASCLDKLFAIGKRADRLRGYAERLHDQDAKERQGQELADRIGRAGTKMSAAVSFVRPEILSIPAKKLKRFLQSPKLADYRHYLDNTLRLKDHVLSPIEEEIIARAGDLTKLPQNVYMTVSTLNVPFPTVTLKDGQRVRMTQSMYTRYRGVADRDDRIKVFRAFWGTYQKYRETYASLLAGVINRDHYFAKVRKYDSALESALGKTNVPTEIYKNMIKQVRAARPLLWRFLRLRKKMLGIDQLGYHDLYASIVPAVDLKYDYDAARAHITKAMAPLGKDYLSIMKMAFDDRWTDVYPTANKRSGAYMSGAAYDVHPFVLLNYNDNYDSMSTTAHEFGHAAHSYLANKYQKYQNADYPIFTAEVASIVNENLLRLDIVDQERDTQKKASLLGQYLDDWRTTVFRQALFAEFELKLHEIAQSGTPLTADLLDRTYLQLLREYYGEAEGVCKIDPLYAVEWAYIPHLYYNFYMFQYTTSFIASTTIANKIHGGDMQTRDNYLGMLKAGGSKYPVDLLKMAGVDLREETPYREAFAVLERVVEYLEQAMIPKQDPSKR